MTVIPEIVDLELTNRCNLDCVMCPRVMQKIRMGDMSRQLLDRVLDEVLEWPGRTFRLHGIGEPLLAPQFRYAVQRIKADPRGHRIGYGKGFYDRLLPRLQRATSCALIFDFQLISEAPNMPGDVPVDLIVTDVRLFDSSEAE